MSTPGAVTATSGRTFQSTMVAEEHLVVSPGGWDLEGVAVGVDEVSDITVLAVWTSMRLLRSGR